MDQEVESLIILLSLRHRLWIGHCRYRANAPLLLRLTCKLRFVFSYIVNVRKKADYYWIPNHTERHLLNRREAVTSHQEHFEQIQ